MSPLPPALVSASAAQSELGSAAVRATKELRRILQLPRRDAGQLGAALAAPLTDMLRREGGTMQLRPLQALALAEAADLDGAIIPLPVGYGKTPVTYLLPTVMASERAVLLVPGALLEKTRREFAELAKHWNADPPQVVSYEKLSTTPGILEELAPDLIIADECHKLKSRTAGCTKRVFRFLQRATSEVRFVGLSGTITKRSLLDFWHLQLWALPDELLVLPCHWKEAEAWAEALDETTARRRPLGALRAFGETLDDARKGFGEMLRLTPGVITAEASEIGTSLQIRLVKQAAPTITATVEQIETRWALPNGLEFSDAVELWSSCIEASQGFYYVWRDEAPTRWLEIRSAVNSFVRTVLSRSRSLETPAQVLQEYGREPLVREWAAVRSTFTPVTVPIWFDRTLVHLAAAWAEEHDGLIWVTHRAFGEALQELGLPFFSNDGTDAAGQHVYDCRGAAVCSVAAMSNGFNLQRWSKNLVPNPPTTGIAWEQLIGRTHRPGQLADTVEVEVWHSTRWPFESFQKALSDAQYVQSITGQAQKLCFADKTGV